MARTQISRIQGICPGCVPSATRIPNSRIRFDTLEADIAKIPVIASIGLLAPQRLHGIDA